MKTLLYLFLLLLHGLTPPPAAAQSNSRLPAVHGRVYGQDEKGANLGSLPGAKIELLSAQSGTVIATATANSPGGYYEIKDLPSADYAYRVTAAGFRTEDAKRGFAVPASTLEYVHDFLLSRPPPKRERCDLALLVVKRVSTGTGQDEVVRLPVAKAQMILRPASAKLATPANQPFITDAKGEFTARDLAVGEYSIAIDAPECQPFIGKLLVVCEKPDQIIFELQPCDTVLHSFVRTMLREGWGRAPPAKTASTRAHQAALKAGAKDAAVDYARALSQLSAGTYEEAQQSLTAAIAKKQDSNVWDRACETRLWMTLCLHQPVQALREARSLVKNHYADRATTPTSLDTAHVCGIALGLVKGPWQNDIAAGEALLFERDLLTTLKGDLRAECEKARDHVAAEFAKIKAAEDAARSRLLTDAGAKKKAEVARLEQRQNAISQEVKLIDTDLQRLQGMSQADEQLRVQLTGFAQQRQSVGLQMQQLQSRLRQLAAMMSQSRQMPPTTRPQFPQKEDQRTPTTGPMIVPQQQPINPQLQFEMQQIQTQLAVLQQQDAQLAASMVNLQNRSQRGMGATQAEYNAKTQRREALAREFDTLDQQRVAPFDPTKISTPELDALTRQARSLKTYRDLPLEARRRELLAAFTCGAAQEATPPSPAAAEIFEKDFPAARSAR